MPILERGKKIVEKIWAGGGLRAASLIVWCARARRTLSFFSDVASFPIIPLASGPLSWRVPLPTEFDPAARPATT